MTFRLDLNKFTVNFNFLNHTDEMQKEISLIPMADLRECRVTFRVAKMDIFTFYSKYFVFVFFSRILYKNVRIERIT